ncbi:hypothetical protein FACS1894204_05840 [Synergistales bacterium]|nr:hypothetical protein FACS1894204_05840 [Synergistales bacterium]
MKQYIVVTLGLVMVGLGALSFIAANWAAIPGGAKIAMVLTAYLLSAGGAYFCEKRERKNISEAMLFLSGFWLLGGIALSAQVFHIQGETTGLLAAWLIAFAPTFILVRGVTIYHLYMIVSVAYMNLLFLADNRYASWYGRRGADMPYAESVLRSVLYNWKPLLLMAALTSVAWYCWWRETKERAHDETQASFVKRVFVGGAARRICLSNVYIINWFVWICIMNSRHESIWPFFFGILIIGLAIEFIGWVVSEPEIDRQGFSCVSLAGLALTFPFVWSFNFYSYGDSIYSPHDAAIAASVALGLYLLWRVLYRKREVGRAVFLFCLLLARWYFDMFYDFMSKSAFFTIGGLLLLFAAAAYGLVKRHMTRKKGGETI